MSTKKNSTIKSFATEYRKEGLAILGNKIKVDGILSFDVVDIFSNDGRKIETHLSLNAGELHTEDFSFVYGYLNSLNFRLTTRKEFIHSLMHVQKTLIIGMAAQQMAMQAALRQTHEANEDVMYG